MTPTQDLSHTVTDVPHELDWVLIQLNMLIIKILIYNFDLNCITL